VKISNPIHCLLGAACFIAARPVQAQTSPVLSLQLYAGVNIIGTTGSVYGIQTTTNVANSNSWSCVALVQLPATNYIWTDTSKTTTTGQQYYRAMLTATNMAYILPGTFTIGSPTNEALRGTDEVQHVVTISKGFYMSKFPVTQGDYLSIVGHNPSYFTGNTNRPVEQVTWMNATNYCGLRTAKEQTTGLIPTNWVYRLPTESEWEYACRAGTVTAFYLGTDLDSGQANFDGQDEYDSVTGTISDPSGVYLATTTPVGNYSPNGWGLFDMVGNVWEWCQDWYGPYPTGSVTDPKGPATGTYRIFRGGSWIDPAVNCRSSPRAHDLPTLSIYRVGFRVVLAPAP
jgi:formylglycine-generating enzyme required for sulfatase activity